MGFTALIDVAVGLTLLYLGASLFVTIANEYIAQLIQLRVRDLKQSLKALLEVEDVGQFAKQHPMLRSLLNAKGKPVTYVDPVVVAQAMIGALRLKPSHKEVTKGELQKAIEALSGGRIKEILLAVSQSSNTVEKFADDVAQWVDRSLKVLGETYKQKMQLISFGLGFAIAVGFNIDTISAAAQLYRDKELRDRVANAAEQFVKSANSELLKKCQSAEAKKTPKCRDVVEFAEAATKGTGAFSGMPMGWKDWNHFVDRVMPDWNWNWVQNWIGYLLTALAISIGAPFWFDLLNRLVNVRHGIRRPEPEKS